MRYSSYFQTNYGSGIVYATDHGIVKVEIPDLSLDKAIQIMILPESEPSEITDRAAELLQRYFLGERVGFGDISVQLDDIPPFRQKVLQVVRTLQYGEVSTYGEIARLCGSPRAARAVGGALAANPVPVIIPCHRIVATDGRLTGFSAPGGKMSKSALLKMEGAEFKGLLAINKQLVMHNIST